MPAESTSSNEPTEIQPTRIRPTQFEPTQFEPTRTRRSPAATGGGSSPVDPGLPGLDEVAAVVGGVAETFERAGHRVYLVGGVVRDLVLGTFSRGDDIDLTTDAAPERIKELLEPHATALWTQGERFGTIGATVAGRELEVTTHRAEVYLSDSRNPSVVFGTSIEEDLVRRDFTVNAMAVSLPDRRLLDPFGGLDDLAAGLLRTPRSAATSFGDDPLRMLRAARFLPRFDLQPAEEVVAAATELAPRLAIVSVERIHDELERLLALPEPGPGLRFLEVTGLLGRAVPHFAGRPEAVAEAVALASAPGTALIRRAGLLAPLGADAAAALDHLRYAKVDARDTLLLLDQVERVLATSVSDELVRRVVQRSGTGLVPELIGLAANLAARRAAAGRIDDAASAPPRPFVDRLADVSAREDLSDLDPPLSGRDVMAHLGLEPGPEVGAVMSSLRHHRLVNGPFGRAAALALLDHWAAETPGRQGR